jgi:hypothetical protein
VRAEIALGMQGVAARGPIAIVAELTLVCAVSLPAAGLAQAPPATEATAGSATATTQWSVGVGTVRYVAEEHLPGGTLFNREAGDLPQWTLGLAHAVSDWTWSLALRQTAGILEYRGRNQIGLPFRTTTDLRRDEWEIVGDHRWEWDSSGVVTSLGTGVQGVRTRRHIRATAISGELTETLRSRRWLLRAGASVLTALDTLPLRLGASAQLDRPGSQTLAVDTHGVFDAFVVRPAFRWGGTFRLDAAFALSRTVEVGCYAAMQTDRPGPSASTVTHRNGAPAGSASYPGSVQKSRLFGATLSGSF